MATPLPLLLVVVILIVLFHFFRHLFLKVLGVLVVEILLFIIFPSLLVDLAKVVDAVHRTFF